MKHARFFAGGRVHHGTVVDGQLLDEAGHSYAEHEVTWLPPVVPPKVIGLALNYADHAKELELKTPEAPARDDQDGKHDDARHDRREHHRLQRADPLAEPPHHGDLHRSEEPRGQCERGGQAGRVHRR